MQLAPRTVHAPYPSPLPNPETGIVPWEDMLNLNALRDAITRLGPKVIVVEVGVQFRMRYLLPVQGEIRYHGKTALETLYDPLRSVQGLTRT